MHIKITAEAYGTDCNLIFVNKSLMIAALIFRFSNPIADVYMYAYVCVSVLSFPPPTKF